MEHKKRNITKVIAFIIAIIMILTQYICIYVDQSKINAFERNINTRITNLEARLKHPENTKYVHFSLDDFILSFKDITENSKKYDSIFDNKLFGHMKSLHDEYGIVFSCYCFYETEDFTLSDVTDKFAEEFFKNADWLKFGFHGHNGDTKYDQSKPDDAQNDYEQVINQLLRITGTDACIDRVPRIHYYAGNEESLAAMINTQDGLQGLLTADDDRQSYYLDQNAEDNLDRQDMYYDSNHQLCFYTTDFRLEKVNDVSEALDQFQSLSNRDQDNILIVFTHEWQLTSKKSGWKMNKLLNVIAEQSVVSGYIPEYPMNIIN